MQRSRSVTLIAVSFGWMVFNQPANAEVDVHIGIAIPPPPHVVFEREPEVVVVPNSRVYYAPSIDQYDMYRYGPYWYVNQGGYWYRSRQYGGPFAYIQYQRVPLAISRVPHQYRRFDSRPPRHSQGRHDSRHDHDYHEDHGNHQDRGHHHKH